MKKSICLFTAVIVLIFTSVLAHGEGWSVGYQKIALNEGIISSMTLSYSYDNRNIDRAYFCELMYTAMNKKIGLEPSDNNIYTDTDSREIAALSDIGIIKGKGEGKFCPEDTLTREEAATIVARAADIIGTGNYESEVAAYKDDDKFSDWARESIYRVTSAGIMQGSGMGGFSPQDTYSKEEAIVTVLRLYASTPVEKTDTEKTELMDNVYVYKNSVATWIEDNGEIKICTNSFDGKYVCGGVLSDGRRVVAVSQEKNHVASSKQIRVISRAFDVYDLSNCKRILTNNDTGVRLFNDYLLTYSTWEEAWTNYEGKYWEDIAYTMTAYDLVSNHTAGWYEFIDGETTLITTDDEIKIYRGNDEIKTISGKISEFKRTSDNSMPKFSKYFEVNVDNHREVYDKDGNLIYTYPETVNYNAETHKFEFRALKKQYEADTPHDEFTEKLSENVSMVCSAEHVRILNDGNEVLTLKNAETSDVMLMEEAGVIAVADTADKSVREVLYEDNITLYNISDGSKRVTLDKKGRLSAYCNNNIFIAYSQDNYGRIRAYDIDGNQKTDEMGRFAEVGKWGLNNVYDPKRHMEFYTAEDGLHRCDDFSLVVPGDSFIAMDEKYIEMKNGYNDVIVYDYDGNVIIKKENCVDYGDDIKYYETSGGRKLFYSITTAFEFIRGEMIDTIKVFDYETGNILIETEGNIVSKNSFSDNYAFLIKIRYSSSGVKYTSSGVIMDYNNNIVYEGDTIYPVNYNDEIYFLEDGDEAKLYRASDLEVVEILPREVLRGKREAVDSQGRKWVYNNGELTCEEP